MITIIIDIILMMFSNSNILGNVKRWNAYYYFSFIIKGGLNEFIALFDIFFSVTIQIRHLCADNLSNPEIPRFFHFKLIRVYEVPEYWTTVIMEDPIYIRFSSYWDDLFVTGVLPLGMAMFFNLKIYLKVNHLKFKMWYFILYENYIFITWYKLIKDFFIFID